MTGAEGRWRDKGGAGLENDKEKERENGEGRRRGKKVVREREGGGKESGV